MSNLIRIALEGAEAYLRQMQTTDTYTPGTRAHSLLQWVLKALDEINEPDRCEVCGAPTTIEELYTCHGCGATICAGCRHYIMPDINATGTEHRLEDHTLYERFHGRPEPECCYLNLEPAYYMGVYFSLPGKPCGKIAQWAIHEQGEPYDILTYACEEHLSALLGHEGEGEGSMIFEVWPADWDVPVLPGSEPDMTQFSEVIHGTVETVREAGVLNCIVAELEDEHGPRVRSEYISQEGCSYHTFEDGLSFRVDADGTVTGPVAPLSAPPLLRFTEEADKVCEEVHGSIEEAEEEKMGFCCPSHEAIYHVLRALELAGKLIEHNSEALTNAHFTEELAEEMREEARQEEVELLTCEACGCGGLTREEDYCHGCGHIVCVPCCERVEFVGMHRLEDHYPKRGY